jgi:cell division initiation protein
MSKSRITALEIEKKEFSRALRGYQIAEVRAYLERVASEVEYQEREIRSLRDRLAQVEADKRRLEELEDRVKDTLLVAQSAADQARDAARREGESILREAESRRLSVVADIERLKSDRAATIASMRSMLEAFLGRLEANGEAVVSIEQSASRDA